MVQPVPESTACCHSGMANSVLQPLVLENQTASSYLP
jgi:hypothetical protein